MRGRVKVGQNTEEQSTLKAIVALGIIIIAGVLVDKFAVRGK